jgi:hypothetical protein
LKSGALESTVHPRSVYAIIATCPKDHEVRNVLPM